MVEKTPTAAKSSAMLSNSLLSSPPRLPSSRSKERRNPSITPRKFRRFFTPRPRLASEPTAAGRALRDLTAAPVLNRCLTPSSPLKPISEDLVVHDQNQDLLLGADGLPRHATKRRKVQHTPDSTPRQLLSPSATSPPVPESPSNGRLQSPLLPFQSSQSSQDAIDSFDDLSEDELTTEPTPTKAPVPLTRRGLGGQLLQRMIGGMPRAGLQRLSCPVADWRTDAADFCTAPEEAHLCSSHEDAARCIPFCTAACNSNSLVAVGDEEGYVRLLDSSKDFDKIHLTFQAHTNAVIDLAFSEDDYLLASASGDQTGKVIDMMTQSPVAILTHHTASLKQVRFQPGRNNRSVLATSSRDGSVQIWDLRCHGGPVQEVAPMVRDSSFTYRLPRQVKSGCVVNSIYDAHGRMAQQSRAKTGAVLGDVARVNEVPGRIGEVSVTGLQFLPEGREHLLLTSCEADATIKLWDIRSIHSSRSNKSCVPISQTAPPDSHASWRPFGISSMALSTDGARLYSVCKDNTIYAYSTAHLVLGHSTELTASKPGEDAPRRKHYTTAQEGLGPIYGFRHPQFHATSFYVKAAIRKAVDGRSEMLAVGSSNGCAVLFPTDERYMRAAWDAAGDSVDSRLGGLGDLAISSGLLPPRRPGLQRANSITNLSARLVSNIPIVQMGTPLIRGHDKEVGAVSWTHDGKLITVGDDYLVRCWSEDRDKARDLRTGGEGGGRRWAAGWANVGEEWEGDDDDW
ncbi:WD40 repeat-like protein [Thozetella sp. PMI_491]|nr:WD40 repeat-like protein [Thozetella sp. PMI_491]